MALGLVCLHGNCIPCVLFAPVWQAKEEQVGGDMKGDGMQNGGTLVVEKGEMSFPSVSISLLSLAVFSSASSSIIICFTYHWEIRLLLFPLPLTTTPNPHHPTQRNETIQEKWTLLKLFWNERERKSVMYKSAALQFSTDPQLLQDCKSLEVLRLGFVIFFPRGGGGGGWIPCPREGWEVNIGELTSATFPLILSYPMTNQESTVWQIWGSSDTMFESTHKGIN